MKVELENVLKILRDINSLNGFKSFSAYTECYTRIKNLSFIQGEWIADKNGTIKCSQCLVPLNEFQANFGINNYCPACGIYMKRRNKNEN